MKKLLGIFAAMIVLVGMYFMYDKLFMNYVYYEPTSNKQGLPYISKSIKVMEKALNYARQNSKKEGLDYEYVAMDVYGSGFINNIPIPNDLDLAVLINLGEYEYDGNNTEQIAKSLLDKMNAYEYYFVQYINDYAGANYHTEMSNLDVINNIAEESPKREISIRNYMDKALSGKEYMAYEKFKVQDEEGRKAVVEIPYLMEPYELLLANYSAIFVYSDAVTYSKNMPKYQREISVTSDFFFTINEDGKKYNIEIVPESFRGERMQLKRRLFAPNFFISPVSDKYIKNYPVFKDEDLFFKYRMLSFRRHLQIILDLNEVKEKPVKRLKRILQTAYILRSVLSEEQLNFIVDTVSENLYNKDIQLLNEIENLHSNLYYIVKRYNFFEKNQKSGRLEEMYKTSLELVNELESRGNVSKDVMTKIKSLTENEQNHIIHADSQHIYKAVVVDYKNKFSEVKQDIYKEIYSMIKNEEDIQKCIKIYTDIFEQAGFKNVTLYWLDGSTVGVVSSQWPKNITSMTEFAKQNHLPQAVYKKIGDKQIPEFGIRNEVWARVNPTKDQDKYYEEFKKKMLSDMQDYKMKRAIAFPVRW